MPKNLRDLRTFFQNKTKNIFRQKNLGLDLRTKELTKKANQGLSFTPKTFSNL